MTPDRNDLPGCFPDLKDDQKSTGNEEDQALAQRDEPNHSTETGGDGSEPIAEENDPQAINHQKTEIVFALMYALIMSAMPIVLMWGVISVYDEDNRASRFLLFLFGGGGFVSLGFIWNKAIKCIEKNRQELRSIIRSNQPHLSLQERLALHRRKRKKRIIAWHVLGFILAGTIAAFSINAANTANAYQEAVLLFEIGSYTEAKDRFEDIREKNYRDTNAYIALCDASVSYDNGRISAAYYSMRNVRFSYLTTEQSAAIDAFTAKLNVEYEEYKAKAAEAAAKAYRERIANGVPFVGMPESEIGNTSLGSPDEIVRHNSEMIKGERMIANLYDFKSGNRRILTARCVNGTVTEVWVYNYDTNTTYNRSKITTGSQDDDPYNAKDYTNEEDFYDDHYDDFFSYEDAEDYYREHHP